MKEKRKKMKGLTLVRANMHNTIVARSEETAEITAYTINHAR
jgi:hypothetical protein